MKLNYWFKKIIKYIFNVMMIYFFVVTLLLLIFRWAPIPTSSFMMQHNIIAWWQGDKDLFVRYQWVTWDNLPKTAALAVIAAEDQRFPQHYGLDFHAIKIAWSTSGKRRRGASTITQQVVKNLFLWSDRSYFRKALEASIAVLMETLWSKQRILEVYLNIAQFGQQDYGVWSACQHLLKRKSCHLNNSQAALLAAALPAPSVYRIERPSQRMRKKQRWIKKQMQQLGGLKYLYLLSNNI